MDTLDLLTQNALDAIWKENVALSIINHKLDKAMDMLDLGTQMTLDAIWKENVALSIINHNLHKK